LYVDHGKDFYAGITFNNEPTGRKIMIDWAKTTGHTPATFRQVRGEDR